MTSDFTFSADADANIRTLDRIARNAAEQAEKFSAVRREVGELSVTEDSSRDGVRVTVSPSGAVTALAMNDRVRAMEPEQIAAAVLRSIQRAQGRIADAVQDVVDRNVGEDSETARNVVASFSNRFPEPPPDGPIPGSGGEPERPRLGSIEDDIPPAAERPTQPPPRRSPAPHDGDDDDWGQQSFLGRR